MIDEGQQAVHRRYNPLTGEWVLVSPQRAKRPWLGQCDAFSVNVQETYDPKCYLCPGNQRANSQCNPNYQHTFIFANDYPALINTATSEGKHVEEDPLFRYQNAGGETRVICYSPDHSKTLPLFTLKEIEFVIYAWQEQVGILSDTYLWVQCFENKGTMMGCSQPHPHGQIWACNFLPNEAQKEDQHQKIFYKTHKCSMLLAYVEQEMQRYERIVLTNEHWVVLVPYWAVWPFETLVIPTTKTAHLSDLSSTQRCTLADILQKLTIKYDNLFHTSFPYCMGWHGLSHKDQPSDYWQLHAHFYPPLLRSSTVKKFMVGFEMLSEVQRDMTAEQAAYQLRAQSTQHYRLYKKDMG